jgi:hypothetical protein
MNKYRTKVIKLVASLSAAYRKSGFSRKRSEIWGPSFAREREFVKFDIFLGPFADW